MTCVLQSGSLILLTIACMGGFACQLKRPVTIPARMIEPQMLEPPKHENGSTGATPIRLLDTQARAHIGRRLLHQGANGELTEDPVWRWTSAPDRYLDTALRLELTSNSEWRLVDSGNAPTLAATLLVWDLESSAETRLVGAVQFQFVGTDRVVHVLVVRATESVSPELPGNLAAAAGSLLHRLVSEGVAGTTHGR